VGQLMVQLVMVEEEDVALVVGGASLHHCAGILVRRFLVGLAQHLLAEARI